MGYENTVTSAFGSISGGSVNTVNGTRGSISGGYGNTVNGAFGSILGGFNHVIENFGGTGRHANFNDTNSTDIETIPHHHPEDRIAALEDHSPFNCTAEEGWCKSEKKRFLFTEGVVIGRQNTNCAYGRASLSVDKGKQGEGTNCPSGKGSVTFGSYNDAPKNNKFSWK